MCGQCAGSRKEGQVPLGSPGPLKVGRLVGSNLGSDNSGGSIHLWFTPAEIHRAWPLKSAEYTKNNRLRIEGSVNSFSAYSTGFSSDEGTCCEDLWPIVFWRAV